MAIDPDSATDVRNAITAARVVLDELHLLAINETRRGTEVAVTTALSFLNTAQLWGLEALRIYLEDGD